MPILQLSEDLVFPPAHLASEDGVLAVGGDTSPQRLLLAYQSGIFPWPHSNLPLLLWFCPDPRFVLTPKKIILSRSLKKSIKKTTLDIIADHDFAQTIEQCASQNRKNQDGTWITDELMEGYCELNKFGLAHSVEAYDGQELVGGLYGVSLGGVFFGESMFAKQNDASKICFATLVANLILWKFDLIDCQSETAYLARFGAVHWPRKKFLCILEKSIKKTTKQGQWSLDITPLDLGNELAKLNQRE